LSVRKARLKKLLAKAPSGIHYNEHIEDDGGLVYEHACKMGLEGIVAKRLDLPYRSGRSRCWIKIRNPKAPAMLRIERELLTGTIRKASPLSRVFIGSS
jgi:bifunctional non-homologous end joining protein LigD